MGGRNEQVTYYYRQHCLIFAQRDYVNSRPRVLAFVNAPQMPLRVIHPQHYLQKIEYLRNPSQMASLGTMSLFRAFLMSIRFAIQRRIWKQP